MNDSVTIAAAAVPLAALAAGLTILFFRDKSARGARIRGTVGILGAGVAFAASLYLLARFQSVDGPAAYSWQFRSWLDISGVASLDDGFGFRIDAFATVIVSAMAFSVIVARGDAMLRGSEDAVADCASLLILAATSLLLCSSHILQFLLFWQLTSTIGFVAMAVRGADPLSGGAARKGLLMGRVGDISLILGLLLLWKHTAQSPEAKLTSWIAVLSDHSRAAVDAGAEPIMLAAAAIFLLGGVATRSGQIPFLGWVDDVASTSTPMTLLLQMSLLMPSGIALMAWCSGVISLSQPLQTATLVIGGFTVFFASLSAACSSGAQRVLGYATCSLLGWCLLGIGSGTSASMSAAVRLLIVQIVASAAACRVVICRTETSESGAARSPSNGSAPNYRHSYVPFDRRWEYLVVAAIAVSGVWGQGSILAAIGETAAAATGVAGRGLKSSSADAGISVLLLVLATLGMLFLAMALFREFFTATKCDSEAKSARSTVGRPGWWLTFSTSIAAIAVLLPERVVGGLSIERIAESVLPVSAAEQHWDLSALGFGALPALIGIVVSWMRAQSAAQPQEGSTRTFAWFVRLSRSRYYFDDFFFLAIELPIRAMGQLSRFFDWFLIDGLLVQIPSRIPAHVAKLARPLQNSAAQITALKILLATAVLLAVILWLRG